MKRILLLWVSITCFIGLSAQENDDLHFTAENRSIIWQKVFTTQLDTAAIINAAMSSDVLRDIIPVSGGFKCTIAPHFIDYSSSGYTRSNTPIYIATREMEAIGQVGIKNNRYRVTISRIVFSSSSNSSLHRTDERTPLEEYALSRWHDGFNKVFYSVNAAYILEDEFNRIFSFTQKNEEDW